MPPLEHLVALEAASRPQSFTRAGDELALTQTAVRQNAALLDPVGTKYFVVPNPMYGSWQ